jgi:GntR family transcriptional regulator/MocR family aminotransferase
LVARLTELFGDKLRFRVPAGGLALWAKAPGVDVEAWAATALSRGVSVRPARDFAFDGRRRPCLRIGFGRANEAELIEATEILAKVLPRA